MKKTNRIFFIVISISILSAGTAFWLARGPKPSLPRPPNILLITVESLRADHLGCYGYKRNTSPHIDKLAREGFLFTRAIGQGTWTVPSITTICTSTYLHTHKAHTWGVPALSSLTSFAQVLKDRGYETFFLGGNEAILGGIPDFDQGFDKFLVSGNPGVSLAGKVEYLIDRSAAKPFFLWVHFMDTHLPYKSGQFKAAFIGDAVFDKEKKLPIVKTLEGRYGVGAIPDYLAQAHDGIRNPDYYVACYDGSIRYVDEQVGRIIERLRKNNLIDNTAIIITSDHGELLGEEGFYFGHGRFVKEPLIRVPLILYAKKIAAPQRSIADVVEAHISIAPTILDLAGIPPFPGFAGKSLLPDIRSGRFPALCALSENSPFAGLTSGRWLFVYDVVSDQFGLYDVPGQRWVPDIKKAQENDPELVIMERELKKAGNRIRKKFPAPKLDDELADKLKSLGYGQ